MKTRITHCFIALLVSFFAESALAVSVDPTFVAASYNLRQANHVDSVAGKGWGQRLPIIAELIRFHGFDIFGTQEGFKYMLDELQECLPGYAYTGIGRDDGIDQGEHSAIFYRTDLFELLDSGDFWLSETPDSPGLGWDAACPRICSWGKFLHHPSGRVFVFMNLHMDHVGVQARIESAKLVKERLAEIAGDLPVMITGDFNVDQTHESYRTMLGNGDLNDSFEIADMRYAPNGTFNSYKTDGYTTSRIDHVFVTPGVEIRKYGVLTDTYRTDDADGSVAELTDAPKEIVAHTYTPRTPSDHFPVMVTLTLPKLSKMSSLKEAYDKMAALPHMRSDKDTRRAVLEAMGLKNIKGGEAAFCGHAAPRAGLLEVMSLLPDEQKVSDIRDDRHRITRMYFNPSVTDTSRGEVLLVIVGHGGNDTVVVYVPSIEKARLARTRLK